jgi:hypothetical protein
MFFIDDKTFVVLCDHHVGEGLALRLLNGR